MPSRSDADLIGQLGQQVRFLQNSAASFDSGYEGEAKRLGTTARVLVHDTNASRSLLEQLGVKAKMAFVETAIPIDARNLAHTPGLVMGKVTSGLGGSFQAPLDHLSPARIKQPIPFDPWWNGAVSKFGTRTLNRRDYILVAANKEGGAHVDPKLDERYETILEAAKAWTYVKTDEADNVLLEEPFENDLLLAGVRQIAHELLKTIDDQLDLSASDSASLLKNSRHLLIPAGTGRNDPCPCGSGNKYKKCHGQ
jgi:SEC-C motif